MSFNDRIQAGPFYPNTCHPASVTRRRFLAGGMALLAGTGLGAGVARAGDNGTAVISRYANSPDDPWRVCHGIRGMGREFAMKDGARAVDWLVEKHLGLQSVNGTGVPGFPLDVEVHPNMFVKTMLEAGVPLDYGFTHQRRRFTLQDVLEGGRALFRPSQVINDPNALPWSIVAFARTTPPRRGRWMNAWGEKVDLDAVVERALGLLEAASLPVLQAMRQNRPETAKAPVHSFTCGGTHMLYGLLSALHAGYSGRDRWDRVRQQVDLLVWRLNADQGLIDRFYKPRSAESGAYWYELDAKVKLLGHSEECLALATTRGLVKLSPGQETAWRTGTATLRRMLEDMEMRNLAEARDIDPELFRQLVGDACHARHGLTYA